MAKISVQGVDVAIVKVHEDDYICITDMLKAKDGDFFYYRLAAKQKYVGISRNMGKRVYNRF